MKKGKKESIEKQSTIIIDMSLDENALKLTKKVTKGKAVVDEFQEDYSLREVSVEELFSLRVEEKAGFVFKKQNRYFYSEIPKDLTLTSSKQFKHLCVGNYKICKNFSSSPVNGCHKVRDLSVTSYKFRGLDRESAVKRAQRIENYDFIKEGFETFNVTEECLVILKCANHK